jgi:hypothetical protein
VKKALKQITLFSLVLAFSFQPFSKVYIYVDFLIHQDYIAKNLCLEKEKPESTCAGNCQLRKELKEGTSQNEVPCKVIQEKHEVQFASFSGIFLSEPKTINPEINHLIYSFSLSDKHIGDIFKPPQMLFS